LLLIGTPDGLQKSGDIRTIKDQKFYEKKTVFWQRAHHASLVHDALYQYLDSIPMSKKDVDNLFYDMLLESGFSVTVAKIYHLAVRYLGASDVGEIEPKSKTNLKLDTKCTEFLANQTGSVE
jgi:Protein of unknown function (DUF1353)